MVCNNPHAYAYAYRGKPMHATVSMFLSTHMFLLILSLAHSWAARPISDKFQIII